MSNVLRKVVYLSVEQFEELQTNGSITVNGVTVTLDDESMYITPTSDDVDVEVDLSNYYTKEEVNTALENINLSNYYTKSEVNAAHETLSDRLNSHKGRMDSFQTALENFEATYTLTEADKQNIANIVFGLIPKYDGTVE